MKLSLVVIAMCVAVGVAHGEKLVAVATANVDPNITELRLVGDGRVALTAFGCDGDDCHVDVVNTATQAGERVHVSRARLDRKLTHGHRFDAALVSYDGRRAGFIVSERDGYHSFAEVDTETGAIKRSTRLARADATTELYPIGADPAHHAVWFYVLAFDGPRRPSVHYSRERSARTLTLRRISLDDLATDDVASLALPARLQAPPLEDSLSVHMSPDFAHAVVLEYYEEPRRLSPPASGYVIDTATGTALRVGIPQVAYGAAFSPDAAYLYLASAVTGEIHRIDLARGQDDLVARGPKLAHHLVITDDGKRLAVLGSARTITSFELPELVHPHEVTHDAAVAMLGSQLVVTPDGLIVAPRPSKGSPRGYVIARIQ